ncbi:hypothetical protein DRE_03484 [Drechslerella stenobrocha 248]|uniref:DMAP1-binding domain-containing protein n=1 Tax=Drechslerella stenobrocha 248 TaxID=1043628 RepID=W7IDP1_9PEZI|nr:hypothetical protein DRE_03484 [Drechslerella stenobrocha 248]
MASPAGLQQKLAELDHEFEEGEITQKGYEKRRTLLLSQFQTFTGTSSSSSSPRASIQSQPQPHAGAYNVNNLHRSPAPASSPTPFQPDSPLPSRYSLQSGQASSGTFDSRTDTMVTAVSSFSTATPTPSNISRSFSQPLQVQQWHQRNPSTGSPAAHARQASYSSYSQAQPAYIQPTYQPPGADYGSYNNSPQAAYDPYYNQQQGQMLPPQVGAGGAYGYGGESGANTMTDYGYEGTNTMTSASTAYFAGFSQQNYDPAPAPGGQLRPDSYQSQQHS